MLSVHSTFSVTPQPWMTQVTTRRIVSALQKEGHEVRFVGGCVRDTVAGREVHDIDLATPLPPTHVIRLLEDDNITVIPTGLSHGTVTAVIEKQHFEITTLRRDVETDGRHAKVQFTDDWNEDAKRRDFTINALSCTPEGKVYDPFGGVADLYSGRIRFVGDPYLRLQEDLLRLLRFFRFHAHYGYGVPDQQAIIACQRYAPFLGRVSGERVRGEVLRLLQAPTCAEVWALMVEYEVMSWLLSRATSVWCLERLLKLENAIPSESNLAFLRLSALLVEVPHKTLENSIQRLRLSKTERTHIYDVLTLIAHPKQLSTEHNLRRTLSQIENVTVLREGVLIAVAASLVHEDSLDMLKNVIPPWQKTFFPLTGQDILDLGYSPGPQVGRLLKTLKMWWADKNFQPNRAACLKELQKHVE